MPDLNKVHKEISKYATKICSFAIFPQFSDFSRSNSETFISEFFVSQIFSSLNAFVPGGTKGHTYLKITCI